VSRAPNIEAFCPACGKQSLLLIRPRYEGFTRVGDTKSCAFCGHLFREEEIQYVHRARPEVFDRASQRAFCRYCEHYVTNPFVQKCMRHRKVVQGTDSCPQFSLRKDEAPEAEAAEGAPEEGPPA